MTDDEEIKRLLGRALADEPPMALDRAEVFRQGRRRLRNRRLFEAGGVAAGVVGAVVGAVVLTGLVTVEQPLPPASGSTAVQPAPPGPDLPVTTSRKKPEATKSAPGGDIDLTAERLTTAFYAEPLITPDVTLGGRPGVADKPRFVRIHDTGYQFASEVYQDGRIIGSLNVVVETGVEMDVSCVGVVPKPTSCTVRTDHGMPMTVAVLNLSKEVQTQVQAMRPDGCAVTVRSSNLSMWQPGGGPERTRPPIEEEDLVRIAAMPELTVE